MGTNPNVRTWCVALARNAPNPLSELRVVLSHNASSPESRWGRFLGSSTAPAINLPVATGAVNR